MTATHHSILKVDRRGRLCDSAEQRSALLSLVAAELEVPSPSGTPMEIILPGGAKLAITSSGQIPIATALIAEVFDNRFVCHLPYYRQAEIFARLGVKLDRKTFCDGSLLASDWLAILYTLVENCRRLGINPRDYFEDVLTRLPAMLASEAVTLTPANGFKARSGKAGRAAV